MSWCLFTDAFLLRCVCAFGVYYHTLLFAQVDAMHETVLSINKEMQEHEGSSLMHVLPTNTAQLHKHLAATSSITNAIMLSGLKNM